MRSSIAVLLFGLIGSGLTGCGKQNAPAAINEAAVKDTPPVMTGEIGKTLTPILSHEYAEACDHLNEAHEKELASVLDQKSSELLNAMKTSTGVDSDVTTVPFGDSVAGVYKTKAPPTDKWETRIDSWDKVYDFYQKIKDTPIDSHWVGLNIMVRSLVTDDYKRVVNRKNVELGRDSGPKIKALQTKVDACMTDSHCVRLDLSADEKAFVDGNLFYSSFQKEIEGEKTEKLARSMLKDFKDRVDQDYFFFSFTPNASVESLKLPTGKLSLKIPFQGRSFSDLQKDMIKKSVETVWKSDEMSLELNWKDTDSSIFKILFDVTKPGERSYTIKSDKLIQLYPQFADRDVAHEVGHALGFSDHYYTTWDRKNCAYTNEMNEADLMGPSSGSVTADDWAELKAAYFSK